MSANEPGLTPEDYDKLRDMAENGVHAYAKNGGGNGQAPNPDGVRLTCQRCGHRWLYRGTNTFGTCSQCGLKRRLPAPDGRGLTVPMCNAIREAARDGLTYREIADLFTFVGDATCVHRHATGRCGHDDHDRPVVEAERDPGPVNAVDADECAALREWYADGPSVNDIADATGRAQSTVYRHVSGECSHK